MVDRDTHPDAVAVRTAPHIIRRSAAGVPNDELQILTRRLPAPMVDAMAEGIRRGAYADLEEFGLARPPVGVKTYVKSQARVPTIDSGTFAAAVRSGAVRVVSGVVGLTSDAARLADGSTHPVDVVVAATATVPPLMG